MKVLIATGIYPPHIGGPATYSKLLNDRLPGQGVSVHVETFDSVRHLPKILRHIAFFLNVFSAGQDADIIFAQDPVSVGLPAFVAARLLGKPFLLKVVGDYAWEQYIGGGAPFISPEAFQTLFVRGITKLRRKIERRVARRAHHVIVPSEYLARIVHLWGVPPDRISVIYNGFDTTSAIPTKDDARRALSLDGSLVVSVGRLVPWKGFETVIRAVVQRKEKLPDLRLVIVGTGPEHQRLHHLIEELQAESYITLTGSVSHETTLRYLAAADMFVLNTGYEGFSHVILEALAAGVPVLTTNIGGNPEIIHDGKNGILVPYNDAEKIETAISDLLSDHARAQRLAEQGRVSLQSFSTERMLTETVSLLRSFSHQ